MMQAQSAPARRPERLVILKIDGLSADLLFRTMAEVDPATGKSTLPWFEHIFAENGTTFDNFYTRGISLSAPSWSMLDTGRHTIIRGNVEYDRYTGETYDYLNFFPFYISYARSQMVDMPGVRELDRAGIPLVLDAFGFAHSYQSFQLFQRGVRWETLQQALKRRFSGKAIWLSLESGGGPALSTVLLQQEENELENSLANSEITYLDYYTGEIDHEGHETNDLRALVNALRTVDAVAGRIWTAIQKGPFAGRTVLAVVSDHGMNNVPGIASQTFSLPDLFNSQEGGGHHVVTDREQFSDYKLRGLNPLVHRVVTASTASSYLKGQAEQYATVWLDIDGNERAAVNLRNSDLNEIHIFLQQLQRPDLAVNIRQAVAATLDCIIDRHRAQWRDTVDELREEMQALQAEIVARRTEMNDLPKTWSREDLLRGEDRVRRRLEEELEEWQREESAYRMYAAHLSELLTLRVEAGPPLNVSIRKLIPEMSLGDNNDLWQLQHYVVGLSEAGLIIGPNGKLDEARSFRTIDYPELLARQRVRNNPQRALSPRPIDFTALTLPDGAYSAASSTRQHAYFLYGSPEDELLILTDDAGRIMLKPVQCVTQNMSGKVTWKDQSWRAGLPLHMFEDSELTIPAGEGRAGWLSAWHTENEWMRAIHKTLYSNAVVGIIEELSPVADNVPGPRGISPVLLRFERRRRKLVQADFHVFASDHWNFNIRFPNPGGNHGAFFRISTHSVWMLAGAGVPVAHIVEPYDSLNFANTLLAMMGRTPPMADKVVPLQ
jgi:predicted AlkP superfamily pyrophosphatase or phosphodiesterase